jgi:hypothetical protein
MAPLHPLRGLAFVGATDGLLVLLLAATRAGRTRTVSLSLLVLAPALLGFLAWGSGGLSTLSTAGFLIYVAIAGVLLGPGAAILAGVVSVLEGVLLTASAGAGWGWRARLCREGCTSCGDKALGERGAPPGAG